MILFIWIIGLLILSEFETHFHPLALILISACWSLLCFVGGTCIDTTD